MNSTGKALTLFQLGSPSTRREIPFGASSAVTPVGLAYRGTHAVVPLGDAASVALVDLEGARIERFFTFPSGNATGVAFVNDTTFLVANVVNNYVGKVTFHQASTAITDTVHVGAPGPTAIVVTAGKAFVVSVNLDAFYTPIGPGCRHRDRSRDDDAASARSRAAAPTPRPRRSARMAWSTW